MLAPLETIRPILVCPRCRGPLDGAIETLRCVNPSCELGSGEPFPFVGRWPVLVDFENSILHLDHVLTTGARTLVPRVSGFMRFLRGVLCDSQSMDTPRMALFRDLVSRTDAPVIVVIGGGTVGRLLVPFYSDDTTRVIAFDIYGSAATQFIADAHQIPLESGSADAVVIAAVLEHVLDPFLVAEEIHRILKPGGVVFAESPFLQQVHEGPYDFMRFTESGHRYLFRRFEHIASGVSGGLGTQLIWSLESFVRGVTRSRFAGKVTRLLFHWLRFADRLAPEQHSIDGASAVYFIGASSTRTVTPREMVAYYRGAQH